MENPTRRELIVSGIGATAAGGAGLYLTSGESRAAVTMGSLSIPDREFSATDGSLHAPWLEISGTIEWSGISDPSEAVVILSAGESNSGTTLELQRSNISASDGNQTYDIAGDVTQSGDFAPADFTVDEDGASDEVQIPVSIVFQVRDSSGDTVASASTSHTTTVTVTNAAGQATDQSVSGSGQILFQDDENSNEPA